MSNNKSVRFTDEMLKDLEFLDDYYNRYGWNKKNKKTGLIIGRALSTEVEKVKNIKIESEKRKSEIAKRIL